MKKNSFVFLFFISITGAGWLFAEEVPECTKHTAPYKATIECTLNEKSEINYCSLAKLDLFMLPINGKIQTLNRYLCLGNTPGRVGNDGQSSFVNKDIGTFFGNCRYMFTPMATANNSALHIYVGLKTDLYKYPEENEIDGKQILLLPGIYHFYAHIFDFVGMSDDHGDPNYDGYFKAYCDDVEPVSLTVKYKIKN